MLWKDKLRLLRWRFVEETDTGGAFLSAEHRRHATEAALRGKDFLLARVGWLEAYSQLPNSALRGLIDSLTVPQISAFVSFWGWVAAALVGLGFTGQGSERLINLLAVPLMGILAWNAVVMLLSLWVECRGDTGETGLLRLMSQWRRSKADGDSDKMQSGFREWVRPIATVRFNAKARAWLHVGAAFLALGSIAGLYAKGWSWEYRVVWESTLLDEDSAVTFFKLLYGPASKVTGVRLPLEEVKAMHVTVGPDTSSRSWVKTMIGNGGYEVRPSVALPWIHLYAGTLALFVIAPRLLLAGLAVVRGRQRVDKLWQAMDWPGYEARLRRTMDGNGEQVTVLTHGWRVEDEPRDRWCAALRERLGGQVRLEYAVIPAGDEDEFAAGWKPANATVVLAFNAAATPEVEVQGTLARDLRAHLKQHLAGARLVALVDAQALRERRSGDSLASRLKLWEDTLKPGADTVIVI